MPRVAIFTFGILCEAHGHPQDQGFFDRDPHTFQAAERSDGFIARSGYENESGPPSWGAHVYPRFFVGDDDDWTPAMLSLREGLESVVVFAYSDVHAEALHRRQEWFRPPAWPTYVAWWVSEAHMPAWTEATKRHAPSTTTGRAPMPLIFGIRLAQRGNR